MENKFIRVDEVADELGVSRPYAYKLIRQLSQNRAEYLHQISLLVPIYPMIWKSKSTNAPCPEG